MSAKGKPTDWEGMKKSTQSFAHSILNSAQKSLQGSYEESRDRISEAAEDLQKDARKLAKKTHTYVRKKPYPLLFGALGVGFLLGLLARRR